ncbi:hypothetical protein L226DRAFT_557589 [Lentinus tigrinus ALCF2SS1-7]|uniref:ABM domain-containing protein n=1 Tax=Lentinus tigrinus ALCF2SS1-6 TaxID=1328759 RepID=A0A5C2SRP6_9APHY|nr:hypothetical protein L227DRAFT_570422 [Lentinus tigrinus ALCF2SS1-6]RPD80479.1 hypothetical protein L226DRAFT_557589 [Lentinus tigrinus ALCF2SS1-7]
MTVTEFATLKLLSPCTWDSPGIQVFFQTLAVQQAEWSGYPLRFFEDVSDTSTIYLITGWKSVPAHYEWIASEQNKTLLERSKGMIEVVGLEHAELDSEVANEAYVVWKQWEAQEGENYEAEGVGRVLDAKFGDLKVLEEVKGLVSSLGTCVEKEAAVGANEEKRFKVMHRLALS